MKYHRVEPGEWMGSIISKERCKTPWKSVWESSHNSKLRSLRTEPNLLAPGDVVCIPTIETKHVPASTGQSHRFVVAGATDTLKIQLEGLQPFLQLFGPIDYELEVGNQYQKGQITSDPQILQLPLQPVEHGTLRIGAVVIDLMIGAMDPIEQLSGMQARLNNLGFNAGPVDGIDGPLTRHGVKAFQRFYNLKVDGIIGPQTRGKMKEIYGY